MARNQSKKSFEKLTDAFRGLRYVYDRYRSMPNLAVSACVERADPSLIFRTLDNIDGARSYVGNAKGERAARQERIFLFSHTDDLQRVVSGENIVQCLREPLQMQVNRGLGSGSSVHYVIWETVFTWYDPADRAITLGETPLRTEVEWSIHLQPEEGWQALLDRAAPAKNVELTTRQLINGLLRKESDYLTAQDRLNEAIRLFEKTVYNQGLRELVLATTKRGMKGQFGSVKLLSYVLAGRIQFQFEAPTPGRNGFTDTFNILGTEPEKGEKPTTKQDMGINAIMATVESACAMVTTVCTAWTALSAKQRTTAFAPDGKVGLGI